MFRKCKNIAKYDFAPEITVKTTHLTQPSLIQPFLSVKRIFFVGDEKRTATAYVDDIYMLFNQQRLAHAGSDTIQAWLNTLTPRFDALSQLRAKCSDEQLMAVCKSRYIQSQSELLAWSEYLNANYDAVIKGAAAEYAKIQKYKAQQQAAQQQAAQQASQQAAQQQAVAAGGE